MMMISLLLALVGLAVIGCLPITGLVAVADLAPLEDWDWESRSWCGG